MSTKTPKGQTGVSLITNLKHNVHNMLAQTEGCPHDNSIQKVGLLDGKLTPTSLRLEVCHNYLCQKSVYRSKGTNPDMRVDSLLPLWSSPKEIQEVVNAGSLNSFREWNPWNW
jgi:hypothetical protein